MAVSRLEARTLEFVNVVRDILGSEPIDELPRGERCSHDRCPVARSLPGRLVSVTPSDAQVDGRVYPFPRAVSDFVLGFDNKMFPHLEEGPASVWGDDGPEAA